jgi:hypothetical protein
LIRISDDKYLMELVDRLSRREQNSFRPQGTEPPLPNLMSLEKGSPPPRRSLLLFPGQLS